MVLGITSENNDPNKVPLATNLPNANDPSDSPPVCPAGAPQWEIDYYEQIDKLWALNKKIGKEEKELLEQLKHANNINDAMALLFNMMSCAGEKLSGLAIQLNAIGDLNAGLKDIQAIYNGQSGTKPSGTTHPGPFPWSPPVPNPPVPVADPAELAKFANLVKQMHDLVVANPGGILDSSTQDQLKDTITQFAGRFSGANLLSGSPDLNALLAQFAKQGLGSDPTNPDSGQDKEKQSDMQTIATLTAGASTTESTAVTMGTQQYQSEATTLVNTSNTVNALSKQMVNGQISR